MGTSFYVRAIKKKNLRVKIDNDAGYENKEMKHNLTLNNSHSSITRSKKEMAWPATTKVANISNNFILIPEK